MSELAHIKEIARATRIQVSLRELNAKLAGFTLGVVIGATVQSLLWAMLIAILGLSAGAATWAGIWLCTLRIRELSANIEAMEAKSEGVAP